MNSIFVFKLGWRRSKLVLSMCCDRLCIQRKHVPIFEGQVRTTNVHATVLQNRTCAFAKDAFDENIEETITLYKLWRLSRILQLRFASHPFSHTSNGNTKIENQFLNAICPSRIRNGLTADEETQLLRNAYFIECCQYRNQPHVFAQHYRVNSGKRYYSALLFPFHVFEA